MPEAPDLLEWSLLVLCNRLYQALTGVKVMQLVTYPGLNGSRERTGDDIGSEGGRGARLDLSRVCSHHYFHGLGQLPSRLLIRALWGLDQASTK